MQVQQLMQPDTVTCGTRDSLSDATRSMANRDCGFVAVTEPNSQRLLGALTDRDICMAADKEGKALGEIQVSAAMTQSMVTCMPGDDISSAHDLMRRHRIRRIPVTDGDGKLEGVLSLNDLSLAADSDDARQQVATTLAAICRHDPR